VMAATAVKAEANTARPRTSGSTTSVSGQAPWGVQVQVVRSVARPLRQPSADSSRKATVVPASPVVPAVTVAAGTGKRDAAVLLTTAVVMTTATSTTTSHVVRSKTCWPSIAPAGG